MSHAAIRLDGLTKLYGSQRALDDVDLICRPGGTLGLINWTPGGFIGEMFAVMKPYAPPPPPGAQPPPCGDQRSTCAGCSVTGWMRWRPAAGR